MLLMNLMFRRKGVLTSREEDRESNVEFKKGVSLVCIDIAAFF